LVYLLDFLYLPDFLCRLKRSGSRLPWSFKGGSERLEKYIQQKKFLLDAS